jgi:hypothetical protein
VPVIVRPFSEVGRIEAMLVENLQRADLQPVDEARAYLDDQDGRLVLVRDDDPDDAQRPVASDWDRFADSPVRDH